MLIEPKIRPSRQPLQCKVGPNGSFTDDMSAGSVQGNRSAHSMPVIYEDDAAGEHIFLDIKI